MDKNIVVCCDGTNSQFGGVNTNVGQLFNALSPDSADQQACYEPGVGTFGADFFSVNIGRPLGKALGAAFGYGLTQNLENAYRHVVDRYVPGDRLFIFGFSRGAFTARSLASLVDRYGVLEATARDRVPALVKAFLDDESAAPEHHGVLCRCAPHFVGVWEMVGALGLLLRLRRFHNNRLSPGVAHGVQALAIDEKRKRFEPTLWDTQALGPNQQVRQAWFVGVHSDVGGGYADRDLADLSLRWMIEHAEAAGLKFASNVPERIAGDPAGRLHQSYKGLWRALGTHVRRIGPDALLHESVGQRLRRRADYDPPNLSEARKARLRG